MLGMPGPDLSEVRVRPHRKMGRGLDVWPVAMRIAGTRSEVRVQRLRPAENVNANPNVVRVQRE
ncbi:MAG: hypothetical protein ABSH17_11325 [Syntrophobacteraceae bacterium]